jgi:hypothetical protein
VTRPEKPWARAHLKTRPLDVYFLQEQTDGSYLARYQGNSMPIQDAGPVTEDFFRAEFCVDPTCEHNRRQPETDPLIEIADPILNAAIAELDDEIKSLTETELRSEQGGWELAQLMPPDYARDTKPTEGIRALGNYWRSVRSRMVRAAAERAALIRDLS